jgi:hypothetical protein
MLGSVGMSEVMKKSIQMVIFNHYLERYELY